MFCESRDFVSLVHGYIPVPERREKYGPSESMNDSMDVMYIE